MCAKQSITVRKEQLLDVDAISSLIEAAFQSVPYSSHNEQFIVDALRRCNKLTVSLVALDCDAIVGHIAISPVTISSGATAWYGLGPISVSPSRQGQGIGSTLIRAALGELQRLGGVGCVVLGEPGYYSRFGFKAQTGLELPDVPRGYFQAITFGAEIPLAMVRYHEAFDARA